MQDDSVSKNQATPLYIKGIVGSEKCEYICRNLLTLWV